MSRWQWTRLVKQGFNGGQGKKAIYFHDEQEEPLLVRITVEVVDEEMVKK